MSEPSPNSPKLVRLQRYLASCGLGSRRACEEFITMGRVMVDGKTVTELGTQIDPQTQRVALDGEKLKMERKKYFVFNKPPGVLCTNRDPNGRPRVIDYFDKDGPRLFTVGRLDEDSEGLLIVTNDGDLAQKLAHPSFRIFRTYHVLVAGIPTSETLAELKKGVYFTEGRFKVEGARSIKRKGQSTWVEVVLAEGHNREVRRMFARMGHKVMKLQRVAFGPIFLGRMIRGEVREIRRDEMERLFGMLERNEAEKTERRPRPTRSAPAKPRADAKATKQAMLTEPPKSEDRGFGLREVSDEEMMGLVERPVRRERPQRPPRNEAGRPPRRDDAGRPPRRDDARRDEPRRDGPPAKKFASGSERPASRGDGPRPKGPRPADGERGPKRPAKSASFKGTGFKAAGKPAGKPFGKATGKRPPSDGQPKKSFGRLSPGQPKRKPRGR
jgi:23S rRNA pseudouridine2605 synthase